MKRIIKVLVVSALMVVLMATTVSPAFASNHQKGDGWGVADRTGYYDWKEPIDKEGQEVYGFGQKCCWKDEEGAKGYGARA